MFVECLFIEPSPLNCRDMEDVVVKILQGEKEVAVEKISSPLTAADAKGHLQDTNAGWVGKLMEPSQSTGLAGQRQLTPGAVYHLYLQVQPGGCTPAPVPDGVIGILGAPAALIAHLKAGQGECNDFVSVLSTFASKPQVSGPRCAHGRWHLALLLFCAAASNSLSHCQSAL